VVQVPSVIHLLHPVRWFGHRLMVRGPVTTWSGSFGAGSACAQWPSSHPSPGTK
jgi:hypothetical protein